MVSSASVQFSLLACLFIAVSFAANPRRGNRVQKPGKKAPQCLYSDYVYSPTLRKCIQTGTKVQCGANMYFMSTGASGKGRCVCRNEIDKPCLGRPQIRSAAKDRCWNLGERGPCSENKVLIPGTSGRIICGVDACKNKKPKNAVNFSPDGLKGNFKFTYRGECYKSESQAFCRTGRIARFETGSKTPKCVTKIREYSCIQENSGGQSVKLTCGEGKTEDPVRSLCVDRAGSW